jgi:uncharacterized damage-inducible protein DinB
MAWANEEILARVAKMPDQALNSYSTNSDWPVKVIISHICDISIFLWA